MVLQYLFSESVAGNNMIVFGGGVEILKRNTLCMVINITLATNDLCVGLESKHLYNVTNIMHDIKSSFLYQQLIIVSQRTLNPNNTRLHLNI